MIENDMQARTIAHYVDSQVHVITNALNNQADRFEEAAKEARSAYMAGQADELTRIVQDGSLMTNNGLRHSAELFEQEAVRARTVATQLARLVEGDDEDDAEAVTWHAEDERK